MTAKQRRERKLGNALRAARLAIIGLKDETRFETTKTRRGLDPRLKRWAHVWRTSAEGIKAP